MSTLKKQSRHTVMFDSEQIEKIAHCERAKATQELIRLFKNLFISHANSRSLESSLEKTRINTCNG